MGVNLVAINLEGVNLETVHEFTNRAGNGYAETILFLGLFCYI